jgi:tetratricopeptide (TPR) repeat protein
MRHGWTGKDRGRRPPPSRHPAAMGWSLVWLTAACCTLFAGPGATPAPAQTAVPDTLASGSGGGDAAVEQRIAELNAKILRDPRNGDLYNDLGVIYAEQENWVLARDAFIAAVQAKPIEASFHRNLAFVMMRLENYDVAAQEFFAYQQLSLDGGHDAYHFIAEAWRRAGETEKAREAYQEGLKALGPGGGAEMLRLALGLSDLEHAEGRSAAARSALEERVDTARKLQAEARADGDDTTAGLARQLLDNLFALCIEDGNLLMDSGLPLEAAALYEKAFALDPSRDEVMPHVVRAYLEGDELMQAKVAVRRAERERPDASGTWQAAGKVAEAEGLLPDAIQAYIKASELEPDNLELKLLIGDLCMKSGDTARAQQWLAAGIASREATPAVVYNYAISLLKAKQYSEAITQLQRVLDQEPEMAPAWQALALSLRQSRRWGEAVDAYRKALSFGDDATLQFNLAYCLSRAGRVTEAVEAYRRAIDLDPTMKEAYYNLGNTLIAAQRYEEALAVLSDDEKLEPNSYRILFNEGLCLYHLGRYEEAISKYEAALEQKETADVYNNLGLVYDKLGQKEEAKTLYREAQRVKGGGR